MACGPRFLPSAAERSLRLLLARTNDKETISSRSTTLTSWLSDAQKPQTPSEPDYGNQFWDLPYDIRRLVYLECIQGFVLEARAIHLPKCDREGLPFHEGWRNEIEWPSKANYINLISTSKGMRLEVETLMWENVILYLSTVNLIHRGLCFVPSVWANVRCVFIDGSLLPHFWRVQSKLKALREVCIAAMDTELPKLDWNPGVSWTELHGPVSDKQRTRKHPVPVYWRLGELLFLENGEVRPEQVDVYVAFRAVFDTRGAMRSRDDMAKLLDIQQGLAHFVVDVDKLEVRQEGSATQRKVQRVLLSKRIS